MDTIYSINKNLTFSDDFISNAIIKSEFLLEKYKDIIEKINENKFIIENRQ
jgi:hypothetical protein